jgi:hypothetical protein
MKTLLVNERTGRQYEVLGRDRSANTITLKGGEAVFTEPYDPKRFKELGYVRKTVEDEAKAELADAEE